MSDEAGATTVAQRLGQLLDQGLLPAGGPAEAAERLIDRLERPARIALLGLPGAGKSAVLNLLAGTVVVPETLRLPTIIVQYGAEAKMLCTLADGRVETVPGSDLSKVMAFSPAMVTLELDLGALKVISLLEVSAGPMEVDQRRAAAWASKRADMVIWCTTSYLPKEQVVWESLPDAVKDNGFLFLTKVDLLGSREAAEGMLERVEQRAGEEFRQVLSVSAKQARTAMKAGGLDRDMFRESGAATVISTIKSRVQMARRADTDMAELLLARHVEASSMVAKLFADPSREETPVSPAWVPPPEEVTPTARAGKQGTTKVAVPLASEPEPELAVETEPKVTVAAEPDDLDSEEILTPLSPDPTLVEPRMAEMEPVAQLAPEPAPSPSAGGKRFSDRIKQIPKDEDAPVVERVPLRTTWKSKADAAAPPQARKEPEPPAAVEPESAPADTGMDDAAIAAMIAAASAPATQNRVARDRSGSSGALARSATPPPPRERPAGGQLFGGRAPAAASAGDLSGLRSRDLIQPDPIREDPRPVPAPTTPVVEAAVRQPRPTETAGRARPPVTARQPAPPRANQPEPQVRSEALPSAVEPDEIAPSPRVAVLRNRQPDPAPPERRERPRIAARVTAPATTPTPAAMVGGPLPSDERNLLDQVITMIASRSASLTDMIDPEEKLPIDLILEHGRETTEQVIDLLSRGSSAAIRRINGDLGEVLDLIMLMQLEKGHAPADDTVTLLLQIRRDLETLRAA